jgi:hypothetical protein
MPLEVVSFEDSILTIREYGRVDAADAKRFERALLAHANRSLKPIVALVDAREATVIMPSAHKYFIRASIVRNVKAHVVATHSPVITKASRLLAMRNYRKNTHVVESWWEAQAVARQICQTDDAIIR